MPAPIINLDALVAEVTRLKGLVQQLIDAYKAKAQDLTKALADLAAAIAAAATEEASDQAAVDAKMAIVAEKVTELDSLGDAIEAQLNPPPA